VAGAWIGLAVKTDGAAVAGGGITEALILAKAATEGIHYQPGWILGTTVTVKVFIDIFIGIWAFILGYIWTNHINPATDGDRAKASEIWQRFPKFILGFLVTFAVSFLLAVAGPVDLTAKLPAAVGEANTFRVLFFTLTFFSIGVLSNFRKLWQEGFGRLAAVYVLSLFGFVIWVGLVIFVDFLQRRQAAARRLTVIPSAIGKEHDMADIPLRAELAEAPVEPLLPIEKKLIVWSLGVGIVLLVILASLNALFPVAA